MKKLLFVILFVSVTLGVTFAQSKNPIVKEYDRFDIDCIQGFQEYLLTGQVAGTKVEMRLIVNTRADYILLGKYRYIRNEKPCNWLGLRLKDDSMCWLGGPVYMEEYNASGKNTGTFFGECAFRGAFEGVFKTSDGKQHKFSLRGEFLPCR